MSMFPEGDTALVSDDPARSLKKWNESLVATYGNIGATFFPEGSQPLVTDDARRSEIKINAILDSAP